MERKSSCRGGNLAGWIGIGFGFGFGFGFGSSLGLSSVDWVGSIYMLCLFRFFIDFD
jgi:hypothetical protein